MRRDPRAQKGVLGHLGIKGLRGLCEARLGLWGPRSGGIGGGAQQSLPIPGVLKPVAVAIAQPHKLVKDDGAEQGSRVTVALQEPPWEQLQPG